MIQHIYDELLTKLDHYKFKEGSDVWAEFVANELLDMIEGFGMLPPYLAEDDQLVSIESYLQGPFVWKPEDSKSD